jgi:hypothetical protein
MTIIAGASNETFVTNEACKHKIASFDGKCVSLIETNLTSFVKLTILKLKKKVWN